MDVSIIIVNYNTCELTRNCLKSVFEWTKDVSYEVIVSDNGSKDGSIEMIKNEFPEVILIENKMNVGFGAANNRGLKIAKGKYIFYLNSDTLLLNNAVKIFYDYWEKSPNNDRIGALGGNLLDEEGKITYSCGCFPKPWKEIYLFMRKIIVVYIKIIFNAFKRNYKHYHKSILYSEKNGYVDTIVGADLFVKNDKNAYFDERYFLYFEETDLEYKMMKQGLNRVIILGPKIVHLCGKSDSIAYDGDLNDYVTFGRIQYELSRIRFIKYNISNFYSFILKIMLSWFWLTPLFHDKVKKYRKEIWKI